MNDEILTAQLRALRMKPNPYLPENCALPPWLICATLGLEYVPGGTYYQQGTGRAFSFGAIFKPMIYCGMEPDENVSRICDLAEMFHEEEQRRGLYPTYEEINLDGTPLTEAQKAQRQKEAVQ